MTGGILSALAIMGLSWGAMPGMVMTRADGFILIPVCGDPGHSVRLPTGDDRGQRGDRPMACHALCTRRHPGDADEHWDDD